MAKICIVDTYKEPSIFLQAYIDGKLPKDLPKKVVYEEEEYIDEILNILDNFQNRDFDTHRDLENWYDNVWYAFEPILSMYGFDGAHKLGIWEHLDLDNRQRPHDDVIDLKEAFEEVSL